MTLDMRWVTSGFRCGVPSVLFWGITQRRTVASYRTQVTFDYRVSKDNLNFNVFIKFAINASK